MRLHAGVAAVVAAGLGAAALLPFTTPLAGVQSAGAQPASAVPFANASFSGYATGDEIHAGALPVSGSQTADVDQAFTGAATASKGLTSAITAETGDLVSPAQGAAVNSYGTGVGLSVGLQTATPPASNQVNVVGVASQYAPNATSSGSATNPGDPPVTTQTAALPNSFPSQIATASALTGRGAAIWGTDCPLGQPISYGLADALNAGLINPTGTPVISTSGANTSVAQTTSETYLSPNGDGSYGLSTTASDVIAPISVSIAGQVTVAVGVQTSSGVDQPVQLTSHASGEGSGASVKLSTDDILTVNLITSAGTTNVISIPLSAVGSSGLVIPLSTTFSSTPVNLTTLSGAVTSVVNSVPQVGSNLSPVIGSVLNQPQVNNLLSQINSAVQKVTGSLPASVSLGSIEVDTAPHAIGQPITTPATTVGGTTAAGALDLLKVHLGVSATVAGNPVTLPAPFSALGDIADLNVGHLETAANLAAPINCELPVIKTVNPTTVAAGQSFSYSIQVPTPADLYLLDCSLVNMTVTDRISDLTAAPNDPAFSVTSATDAAGKAGTVVQANPNNATVTWTGETYTVAAVGSPPNPPLTFTINLSTPSNDPAGTITDTVTAVATTSGCTGGAAGSADLSATSDNGQSLTGSYTLNQPAVTATPPAAAAAGGAAGGGTPKSLAFTGSMGGPWQPVAGVGILCLGGGTLALLRRARRRT